MNTLIESGTLLVLLLVSLAFDCGSRTLPGNKTEGAERVEVVPAPDVTLNGLAFYSNVTVKDILRTFGEPGCIDLFVSKVEDGDTSQGVVLNRSFNKDGFKEFMKLSAPANKDYYLICFHYADSWLTIATPDATKMAEDGSCPADMSFAGHYEIDGFSISNPDWVLSNKRGSVTIGSSLEDLEKMSPDIMPLNRYGTKFVFAPAGKNDDFWSAELKDGKITRLSFQGVSWI